MKTKFLIQLFKYSIVGVLNTLLTAIVIGVMMYCIFRVKGNGGASFLAVPVSNVVGYAVGLINSFVWNRRWTFKSKKNWSTDFLKFILVFLICYIPQLLLVMILNRYAGISNLQLHCLNQEYVLTSAYICQLSGIIFYTALNFLCNKYYTFKS